MTKINQPVLSPQTTYEYLDRVQQLLSAPRRDSQGRITHDHSWIQHAEAIDAKGNHCSPKSDLACAYCTIGAVRAVTLYDPTDPIAAYKYVCSIIDAANPATIASARGTTGGIPSINDSHEFQRVIKMLDKAKQFITRFGTGKE